ncbi:MAG TPA: DUF3108 domain-containing protein [Flavobacteriaceae bacterium]|nr:DUF3108 domain-containing protein [Flavobacteriaceae bacterium]
MKKTFFLFMFFTNLMVFSQAPKAFEDGEWLKFRIHYGWFNASFATLEVKEENFRGHPVYHVIGHGESTGLLDLFFEVDDTYESYINKETGLPMRFIRKINEGGYEKNNMIDFDQANNKAVVTNRIKNTAEIFTIKNKVQDMLSAFYFLRNEIQGKQFQKGDEIVTNMFFDNENYKFVSKFLGRETINTEFGKIACLKFRPFVQAGRVFKEKESLTFWISADKNHIPIKIKAELAVGSLEADLAAFKGLKHPFEIIVEQN